MPVLHVGVSKDTNIKGSPYMICPEQSRTIESWLSTICRKATGNNSFELIQFGLGVRYPMENGYVYLTTTKREIELFRSRGISENHIYAIDQDIKICRQWESSGINIFTANWNDTGLKESIKETIYKIKTKKIGQARAIIINGDNYGTIDEGLKIYKEWIDYFNPIAFFAHFYTRGINSLLRIELETDKWGYEKLDWGESLSVDLKHGKWIKSSNTVSSMCLVRKDVYQSKHNNFNRKEE